MPKALSAVSSEMGSDLLVDLEKVSLFGGKNYWWYRGQDYIIQIVEVKGRRYSIRHDTDTGFYAVYDITADRRHTFHILLLVIEGKHPTGIWCGREFPLLLLTIHAKDVWALLLQ